MFGYIANVANFAAMHAVSSNILRRTFIGECIRVRIRYNVDCILYDCMYLVSQVRQSPKSFEIGFMASTILRGTCSPSRIAQGATGSSILGETKTKKRRLWMGDHRMMPARARFSGHYTSKRCLVW